MTWHLISKGEVVNIIEGADESSFPDVHQSQRVAGAAVSLIGVDLVSVTHWADSR